VSLAAVNTVVKAGRDILMARVVLSVTSALADLPRRLFCAATDGPVWIALGLSLIAHGFYQFGLINALSRGDLSIVFPIMRGGAPILVAIAAATFLGEALHAVGMGGPGRGDIGHVGFCA